MKRILFTIAIIISLTACSKPETPNPAPEPAIDDTTSKSYVGCMRSDYPDIMISGISVNDKIIYDLKSACTYSAPLYPGVTTHLYSGEFTISEIYIYNIFPIVEIEVYDESNNIYISIPEKTFDYEEIIYDLRNGAAFEKTDNIKSVNIKKAEVILDNENFKTDICNLDIEITILGDWVIRIIYSGESIHQSIIDGPR